MTAVLVKNSLLLATGTTLACLILGLVGALAILSLPTPWRRPLLTCSLLALALPPFLVSNCWMDLTGLLAARLDLTGGPTLFSMSGAMWILTWLHWPIALVLIWSSWQTLEAAHLEQDARLAGWPVLHWVLWPLARHAALLAGLVTSILVLNHFAVPALLQVKVLPAVMWVQFNTTFSYLRALEVGWPLLIVPLVLVCFWRDRRVPWPVVGHPASPALVRQRLGWVWIAAARSLFALSLLFSVAVPVGHLLFNARTWSELMPALRASAGPTLQSLGLAALTATACAVAGLCLWRVRMLKLAWIPFVLPGVVLGMVLIFLLNRPGLEWLYRGAGVVVLAWFLRFLAPAWHGLRQGFRGIDPDLTDAARVQGASGWQLLRHVQWPLVASSAGAVWYLVYLLCLWDVETLILITPPGGETLALRVFNLLHYGHNAQVNALCLLLLGLALLPPGVLLLARTAWQGVRPRNAP